MATPRNLTRPPIVEALVDFRAQLNAEPTALAEFIRRELGTEFPNSEVRNALEAKLEVRDGLVVPPSIEDQGFHGIWSSNGDASKVVQFRRNGFTLNHLREYLGGESLLGEALSLWSRYTQAFGATPVERVALRYINRLSLPYKRGEDFDVYLTAAATMPPGTPQLVSEFLTRVVASVEAEDSRRDQLVVTQRLLRENGDPVLVLDIDVFRQGPCDELQLRPVLESLRTLKNKTFFAMLTDAAVSLYA